VSELGPEAKALLDLARGADDPSGADRARVRSAVAARVAIGAAAGAAVTAATTTSVAGAGAAAGAVAAPLGLGMKILFAIGAAAAVGMGAVTYVDSKPPAPRPSATASQVAPRDPPRAALPSATSAQPPRAPAPSPSQEPEPAPSVSATARVSPSAPAAAPSSSVPSVTREVELLAEAQSAINAGDGARALVLLDEHARRFPSGAMSQEREAARVFALCALGRTGEARAAAERFLSAFPTSPQAARVRASCGAPKF